MSTGEKRPRTGGRRRGVFVLSALLAVAVVVPLEPTAVGSPTGTASDSKATAAVNCKKIRDKKKRRRCIRRKRLQQLQQQASLPSGNYAGTTAQGFPISLTVANQAVTAFSTQVTINCTGSFGGQFTEQRAFAPPAGSAPIDAAGIFSRETSDNSGTTFRYSGRFTSATAASGVLNMDVVEFVFGGIQVCATPGDVSWSASRVP